MTFKTRRSKRNDVMKGNSDAGFHHYAEKVCGEEIKGWALKEFGFFYPAF